MRRDVRFRILRRTVTDARGRLDPGRRLQRENALWELASALALDDWPVGLADEDPELTRIVPVLQRIPAGGDRDLVAAALALDVHVYLTRDKKVLAQRDGLFAEGLLLTSPIDLLAELSAADELDVLLRPGSARWPAPDLQRMTHLVAALPVDNQVCSRNRPLLRPPSDASDASVPQRSLVSEPCPSNAA